MKSLTHTTPAKNSKAVANSSTLETANAAAFEFEDHRPEAVAQRKLQESADAYLARQPVIPIQRHATKVIQRAMDDDEQDDLKQFLREYIDVLSDEAIDDLWLRFSTEYDTMDEAQFDLEQTISILKHQDQSAKAKFKKSFFDQVPKSREATRGVLYSNSITGAWEVHSKSVAGTPDPYIYYAFVTLTNGRIYVWPVKGDKDTFHRGLAEFTSEVMYAGEIMFDEDGQVIGWNNKSGNYKPLTENAGLAGLPIEAFVAHEKTDQHIKAYLEQKGQTAKAPEGNRMEVEVSDWDGRSLPDEVYKEFIKSGQRSFLVNGMILTITAYSKKGDNIRYSIRPRGG